MKAYPGEWLFPHNEYNGHTGTYMSDSNWETAWQRYCEDHSWTDEDGKPIIGAHHLRHGTATLLYEAGVGMYTAQHILGHANVTTTLEIYTDLRKAHERKNVGLFSDSMKNLQEKATQSKSREKIFSENARAPKKPNSCKQFCNHFLQRNAL